MVKNKSVSLAIFFLLCVSLTLPNFILVISIIDPSLSGLQNNLSLWLSLIVELILFALIGRAELFLVLQIPFLVWLPFELIYIIRYGAPTSAHILNILAETNLNEILGYVGGFNVLLIYIVYLIWLAWALGYIWSAKIVWRHRSRWWVLIIFSSLCAMNAVLFDLVDKRIEAAQVAFGGVDEFVAPRFGYGLDDYKNTYPFGLVLRFIEFFQQKKVLEATAVELEHWDSGYSKKEIIGPEVYVLVIGESSRADHWAINGYKRDTTPQLSGRQDIINFTDAVSSSATTRTAVPVLLSRSTINNVFESQLKNSWILDFKHHGFKTYWLSTQMPVGTHDTMIGAYAKLVDGLKYLNMGRYSVHSDLDEVLLPALDSALNEPGYKKLIILHTLGSHAPYHFRYPASFAYFKPVPDDNSTADVFDKDQVGLILNAYDNSVRYTDYVLNKIINLVASKKIYSALWYISDHGETFIDEGCASAGHGFGSKYNFHIPVIFWASPTYVASNTDLVAAAQQQKFLPVYSGDFFDTLMQTAGFKNTNGRFNGFLDKNYSVPIRKVATSGAATVDYDQEYKKNACGQK